MCYAVVSLVQKGEDTGLVWVTGQHRYMTVVLGFAPANISQASCGTPVNTFSST